VVRKGRWSIEDGSGVGGGEWFYLVYFWCSIEIPREIPPKRIRPAVPILDTRILNKQIYQILTHTNIQPGPIQFQYSFKGNNSLPQTQIFEFLYLCKPIS